MKKNTLPILAFIFGTFFGMILIEGFIVLRPLHAEEKTEVKSIITEEELDKKLTEIIESQTLLKQKIEEVATQAQSLKAMSGK